METEVVWSAVQLAELQGEARLDAEFWQPQYLRTEQAIQAHQWSSLGDLSISIRKGIFYILASEYTKSGIPFYRSSNVGEITPSEHNLAHISPKKHKEEKQTALGRGNIMLAKTGKERASVILREQCNISQDVIGIRLRNEAVNPFYLATYLNTQVGKLQMLRWFQGQVQPHLSLPGARRILVPLPSASFQSDIELAVYRSKDFSERAEALYTEAEALLLAKLGLDDLDLSHQPTYKQNLSQAWATGRLDAEHFQPKYYTLLTNLQDTGQAVRLSDWLTEPIRRGVQPKYDESGDVIVINSQHVGKTHVEIEDNRRTTCEFVEQNKRAQVRRYDVLLNSTGYITIGRCQTLLIDATAIVDGHVSIIRPKNGLDPVYLGLFLNSLPGQMQTERGWTGSSGQIELRSKLIENYTIWKPDIAFQKHIRELVEKAHVARKEASRLLENAKRQVEQMVLGHEA